MQYPRFSLLTLLLLTTIAAMGIVLGMLWREVGPLREEVRRLRNEVGSLTVADPTKLYAIRAKTDDDFTWKWRIWIPENREYVVRSYGEAISKAGFPRDGGTIWIREPGEHVVEYQIRKDARDGKWYGRLQTTGGNVGKDAQPWVDWTNYTSTGGGVGSTTQEFAPDTRVELTRHRVSQVTSSDQIPDPADGFLIWMEPAP